MQAQAVAEQLEREKGAILVDMIRLEKEKNELAEKMSSSNTLVQALYDSEEFAKEQEDLQKRMDAMAGEMNNLVEKLKQAEETTLAREKMISDRLEREKDELKMTVQRMKEELQQERQER